MFLECIILCNTNYKFHVTIEPEVTIIILISYFFQTVISPLNDSQTIVSNNLITIFLIFF